MQLRRVAVPLPLMLATLALTAGCVTVRPDAPPEQGRPAPGADRTAAVGEAAVEALPLGRLPTSEPPPAPPAAAPEPAPPGEHRTPRRTDDGAPGGRAHPARPAPAPGPRKRPPARPKPRPAPPRSYDMTALCEAAKGMVSPEIVALCR
ncbi:hypothetical protein OV450_4796 [Actinobacteria bacterium OV450]|nr:hypothetical protein OV450_4796 [Actinobacteria bacterium OV450]